MRLPWGFLFFFNFFETAGGNFNALHRIMDIRWYVFLEYRRSHWKEIHAMPKMLDLLTAMDHRTPFQPYPAIDLPQNLSIW